ncbi:hypothetical protein TYRP_007647 [Tyrophagus putrescentiae]|nr:hypothetical protein TYRP_007647 [Tyrophagus putrescentiae]
MSQAADRRQQQRRPPRASPPPTEVLLHLCEFVCLSSSFLGQDGVHASHLLHHAVVLLLQQLHVVHTGLQYGALVLLHVLHHFVVLRLVGGARQQRAQLLDAVVDVVAAAAFNLIALISCSVSCGQEEETAVEVLLMPDRRLPLRLPPIREPPGTATAPLFVAVTSPPFVVELVLSPPCEFWSRPPASISPLWVREWAPLKRLVLCW